jgi:hypothetical protein
VTSYTETLDQIRAAILHEREACARVADDIAAETAMNEAERKIARAIASYIRERSQQ